DVDGVAFVDDVRAVVVIDRFGGISAEGGARTPGGRTPDDRGGGPRRGPPRTRILGPPPAVEAAVVSEVAADQGPLVNQRGAAHGTGVGTPRDKVGPSHVTQTSTSNAANTSDATNAANTSDATNASDATNSTDTATAANTSHATGTPGA